MDADRLKSNALSRRSALKKGAATAFLLSQAPLFEQLALAPARQAFAATAFSDIQFNMGAFVHPAQVYNDGAGNVTAQFPVVFTLFLPAKLTRTPSRSDQSTLANALFIIEASYPASPSGVLIFSVSYGLPYFNRLSQTVVSAHMPHLAANPSRGVLEEAVPFPTDVVHCLVCGPNALIPNVTKDSFNGLLAFQPPRVQFMQPGMPSSVANSYGFEFAPRINPDSSMAMGFIDQQVDSSGPPQIVTFVGNSSAKLTDAQPGSYFDNGSIAHFSHDIEDLFQFYAQPNQDPRHPDGED